MSRVCVFTTIFLSLLLFSPIPTSAEPIGFEFAFVYLNKAGEICSIDFSKDLNTLTSSDRLQLYVKPVENAFIYILLFNTGKNLRLVFPATLAFLDRDYKQGEAYFIPEKSGWFVFDGEPGTEEFHIIASDVRLTKLEKLFGEYERTAAEATGATKKIDTARQAVLDELRRLRKERSVFAGEAGKPVVVAGEYRGSEDSIESFVRIIKAEGFYAKTIRIEH